MVLNITFDVKFTFAFIRCFYPKQLTVHSRYIFYEVHAFPGKQTHDLSNVNALSDCLSHRNSHNVFSNVGVMMIYLFVDSLRSNIVHYVIQSMETWAGYNRSQQMPWPLSPFHWKKVIVICHVQWCS